MDVVTPPSSSSQNSAEPQGFLSVLLSTVFFFAGWSLSKLRDPSKHSDDSRCPQNNATNAAESCQSTHSTPIRVVIDSAPPTPTPDKKREARETDQESRDKKRFAVE